MLSEKYYNGRVRGDATLLNLARSREQHTFFETFFFVFRSDLIDKKYLRSSELDVPCVKHNSI